MRLCEDSPSGKVGGGGTLWLPAALSPLTVSAQLSLCVFDVVMVNFSGTGGVVRASGSGRSSEALRDKPLLVGGADGNASRLLTAVNREVGASAGVSRNGLGAVWDSTAVMASGASCGERLLSLSSATGSAGGVGLVGSGSLVRCGFSTMMVSVRSPETRPVSRRLSRARATSSSCTELGLLSFAVVETVVKDAILATGDTLSRSCDSVENNR